MLTYILSCPSTVSSSITWTACDVHASREKTPNLINRRLRAHPPSSVGWLVISPVLCVHEHGLKRNDKSQRVFVAKVQACTRSVNSLPSCTMPSSLFLYAQEACLHRKSICRVVLLGSLHQKRSPRHHHKGLRRLLERRYEQTLSMQSQENSVKLDVVVDRIRRARCRFAVC